MANAKAGIAVAGVSSVEQDDKKSRTRNNGLMQGGIAVEGLLVNDENEGWSILLKEGDYDTCKPLDSFFKLVGGHWVKMHIQLSYPSVDSK